MPAIWIKLWCDALFTVIKHPKSRGGFEKRSRNEPIEEWKLLSASTQKGRLEKITGSLFLGAMEENAEQVPFQGLSQENFLLNFWPVVMGVHQPAIFVKDAKTKIFKDDFKGYVITIPDVINVPVFCLDFKHAMQQLTPESAGYRPKGSIISLPQEGALAYGSQLMQISRTTGLKANWGNVCGMEVYHLYKPKGSRSVHLLASDRLEINTYTLRTYHHIRSTAWNPLFKRQCILNLLSGKPWYKGFERTFSTQSKDLFLGNSPSARLFAGDVGRKLKELKGIEQLKRSAQ